jgi:hypothetical protein
MIIVMFQKTWRMPYLVNLCHAGLVLRPGTCPDHRTSLWITQLVLCWQKRFHDGALFNDNRLPRMAPNLAESQHVEIRDMILSKSLKAAQMAKVAGCSTRSVRAIRSNLRYFGTTRGPSNGGRTAPQRYSSDARRSV